MENLVPENPDFSIRYVMRNRNAETTNRSNFSEGGNKLTEFPYSEY
ncbi:hypothetical protein LBBP_02980 [Leptospira borgpetersenii serovar Ballum]|uniref:Uncharacterized protein n=1 Tax=Leptospira borgpetersenii serovar Ballum TaxID=280505 RepID=A0A0S2IU76_LEPBO|nr:hypothetical protein LBBP_02980 [Leptospira borgpetersenii serovar Ballum]